MEGVVGDMGEKGGMGDGGMQGEKGDMGGNGTRGPIGDIGELRYYKPPIRKLIAL